MNATVSGASTRASNATRLAGYLAAGVGSTMLATSHAEAAIQTIDLTNCGTNNQNITGVSAGISLGGAKKTVLGFVPGGNLDIYFSSGDMGLDADNATGAGNLFQLATGGSGTSPTNFATGSTIIAANAANWSSSAGETEFWIGANQSPDFGAGSFMGFRFSTNSGTDWNYGYIEVLWTYTGTASTSTFQFLSAAYETTANTGILAGATTAAVPAGGGLMALMALGGGAFRRRGRVA